MENNLWDPLPQEEKSYTLKIVRHESFWKKGFRRLLHNQKSIFAMVVLLILILASLIIPCFWPFTYGEQNLKLNNLPPVLQLYEPEEGLYFYATKEFTIIETDGQGNILGPAESGRRDIPGRKNYFHFHGKQILVDYSLLTEGIPSIYYEGTLTLPTKKVWNKTYILGSDSLGRDIFIRILYGARISLTVSFITVFVNLIIGVIYGSISGYFGGSIDNIMMRIIDIISSIPMTMYVILIMIVLGQGFHSIILAMGLVMWIRMARIVRGQVLYIRNQEFVLAAQCMGISIPAMIFRHFLPNMMGPVLAAVSMQIPNAIFQEAFLSFIGLGVSAPQASWGTLCNDALGALYVHPYQMMIPAIAISVTILAFHLLNRGLQEAFEGGSR